jgi:hypothetical protein
MIFPSLFHHVIQSGHLLERSPNKQAHCSLRLSLKTSMDYTKQQNVPVVAEHRKGQDLHPGEPFHLPHAGHPIPIPIPTFRAGTALHNGIIS